MSAICIIPARGGSVRVPRKNIKDFHGKPIIQYSIETAKESGLFDKVVVSTDDGEIAMVAHELGAMVVMRPKCDGSMGTQEVAAKTLEQLEPIGIKPDYACVLYATSPLLLPSDLAQGIEVLARREDALYAMSVQASPLADAGCCYWGHRCAFAGGLPLIAPYTAMVPLPPERICDINTHDDWARAESMFTALRRAHV